MELYGKTAVKDDMGEVVCAGSGHQSIAAIRQDSLPLNMAHSTAAEEDWTRRDKAYEKGTVQH